MTRRKSFKLLVRSRMEKTGESYTAARTSLLHASVKPEPAEEQPLATSDAEILRRTGRGWEAWFDLLDEWGAAERTHREIARWIAEQQGIEPLAWNAQAVAGSYERARGLRAVGEHADGFRVSVTKTVAVPVDRLFDAFVDTANQERWLPDGKLRTRKVTRPTSAHFDWDDDGSRVHVTFTAKDESKSTATVSHERLADAEERDRMKAYWRERVTALKEEMER